jgi:3'-5' exoribonuclease
LRGRIENYQNNLQLIIEQMAAPKDGSFDLADLIPTTTKDVGQMFLRVTEICQSIQNRHLAVLVQAYLDDAKLMEDFRRAPAAMSFHHAFLGGLLEHTLNAMEVGDAVCKFYPLLNRDLVISGIFLHDIAKTWELSYAVSFGYTDGGQLVGHVVKSAMWVEEKAKKAEEMLGEPVPRELIDVMQHIILSHHGQPEFGAARTPSTPEAIAVHVVENLDAKMMMALSATRGEASAAAAEGNWTEYVKALGGRLYRPDVAPADVQVSDEKAPEDREKKGGAPPAQAAPAGKAVINNPLFETSSGNKR